MTHPPIALKRQREEKREAAGKQRELPPSFYGIRGGTAERTPGHPAVEDEIFRASNRHCDSSTRYSPDANERDCQRHVDGDLSEIDLRREIRTARPVKQRER